VNGGPIGSDSDPIPQSPLEVHVIPIARSKAPVPSLIPVRPRRRRLGAGRLSLALLAPGLLLWLAVGARVCLAQADTRDETSPTLSARDGTGLSDAEPIGDENGEEAPARKPRKSKPRDGGTKLPGQIGIGTAEKLLIQSLSGMVYGQNDLYIPEHSRMQYGNIKMEADSFSFRDPGQMRVEAVGNVRLTIPNVDIQAEKMYFNFRDYEGKAFKAKGTCGPVYFEHAKNETQSNPSFQIVSRNEILLHGASVTTCDLGRPHYHLRAREITIFLKERIFFRDAVLYLHTVPVFYMPFYTRSLRERSPWFFWGGYHSRLGPWARLGYTYKHEERAPAFEDDEELRTISRGQLTVFANEFAKRGPGGGLHYKYSFGSGRHEGDVETFYLDDGNRDVRSRAAYDAYYRRIAYDGRALGSYSKFQTRHYTDENDLQRYQIGLGHRSQLSENATMVVNVDYLSDPDLSEEALDIFTLVDRRRVMVRRARAALTWADDDFTARILFELKDRIGRNRVTNFSNPADILRDFDEQPELPISERTDKGITTDRWGRVTERAPEITASTAWVKLWNLPFYYRSDLHLFNNLDKGLNTVSTKDDSFVQGVDWYNALMWRLRLAPRVTWLNQAGAGAGAAQRRKTEYGYLRDSDFYYDPSQGEEPYYLFPNDAEGGLVFKDPETFLIGSKWFNLRKDVSNEFFYGDVMSQLQAAFTDALTGSLAYRYRATTDNYLGDWYAQIGNRYARDDLYDFPLRENNVRARLQYVLAQPRLTASFNFFRNLISEEHLYPGELVSFYGPDLVWQNQARTLSTGARIGMSERQMYHPSDPSAYIDSSLGYGWFANYAPTSQLWWGNLAVSYSEKLNRPLGDRKYDRYIERQNPYTITGGLGGKVGPKYTARVSASWRSEYGTLDRFSLSLQRDLHDARIMTELVFKQDTYSSKYEGGEKRSAMSFTDQMDFRVAFVPQLPGGKTVPGMPEVGILQRAAGQENAQDATSVSGGVLNLQW